MSGPPMQAERLMCEESAVINSEVNGQLSWLASFYSKTGGQSQSSDRGSLSLLRKSAVHFTDHNFLNSGIKW